MKFVMVEASTVCSVNFGSIAGSLLVPAIPREQQRIDLLIGEGWIESEYIWGLSVVVNARGCQVARTAPTYLDRGVNFPSTRCGACNFPRVVLATLLKHQCPRQAPKRASVGLGLSSRQAAGRKSKRGDREPPLNPKLELLAGLCGLRSVPAD